MLCVDTLQVMIMLMEQVMGLQELADKKMEQFKEVKSTSALSNSKSLVQ